MIARLQRLASGWFRRSPDLLAEETRRTRALTDDLTYEREHSQACIERIAEHVLEIDRLREELDRERERHHRRCLRLEAEQGRTAELRRERDNLRAELEQARASLTVVSHERDTFQIEHDDALRRIAELEDRIHGGTP